jgi:hypothetical protein
MCSTAPNPQHYSECICEHCEKHQTGFFAQRNFLAGDDAAATLLSSSVAAFLKQERARMKDPASE